MRENEKRTIKVSYLNITYDVNHLHNNRGLVSQISRGYPNRYRRDPIRTNADSYSWYMVHCQQILQNFWKPLESCNRITNHYSVQPTMHKPKTKQNTIFLEKII